MRCKKYKELIILHLYKELEDSAREDLLRHIQECASCARDLEYTREVFDLVSASESRDLPQADWEKCWGKIATEVRRPPQPRAQLRLVPAWVAVTAAVIMVFAAGLITGRFWSPGRPPQGIMAATSLDSSRIPLAEHFESLKPLLIEYANFATDETNGSQIIVDRAVIKSLLVQNYLLMCIVAKDDPDAIQLLEDIDLVLRDIENLESRDQETPVLIKDFIQKKELLFKIDVFQKL